MKSSRLILIALVIVSLSLCCLGQPRLSDSELKGLKGKVKKVETGPDSETFDREGYLTRKEEYGGNCILNYLFTFSNSANTERVMQLTINDFSNSGFCSQKFSRLPKKDGAVIYNLSRSDGYVSYENKNSNRWQTDETATVEKILQWRYTRLYDAKSRLLEEFYVNNDLLVTTILYNYLGNSAEPISIEFSNGNRFSYKYWYKYEEFDKYGNWTKRTSTKVEPASMGGLSEIKRVITYYEN